MFTVAVPALTYGQAANVNTTVSGNGSPATGSVSLREGARTLDTATLSGGAATFSVDPDALTPGSVTLVVQYDGDGTVDAGQTSRNATVAKSAITSLALEVETAPRVGPERGPSGSTSTRQLDSRTPTAGSAFA